MVLTDKQHWHNQHNKQKKHWHNQHYHLVKVININILQVKKYYHLTKVE